MAEMTLIEGGVCAAAGFKANGLHCGIRANREKKDLALVMSDVPCNAAAVHTRNLVTGAPNTVTKQHLENGKAQAIICNSGIANTCNANGIQVANATCAHVGRVAGIDYEDVVVASTGVIGEPLDTRTIVAALPELFAGLDASAVGARAAAEAIMTTDTKPKQIAVEFELDGKLCHLGGMAKGSGMIHPNMATMLVFLTSDVAITSSALQRALKRDVNRTFNMLSVDGDTSTNDMVVLLANGLAGNAEVNDIESEDFATFMCALNTVTVALCREIAADGEGATKMLDCTVSGATSVDIARIVAKKIVCSSLVKTAMFGADANWGRVLCAIGYAGVPLDVNKIDVRFKSKAGEILVCENGAGVVFLEEKAKEILLEPEIEILVDLKSGTGEAEAWGCDLSYEYVRINGDYRS